MSNLMAELFDRLTVRGYEIDYNFQNLEIGGGFDTIEALLLTITDAFLRMHIHDSLDIQW